MLLDGTVEWHHPTQGWTPSDTTFDGSWRPQNEKHRLSQRWEWVLKGARKRFCPSIYHKPFNPPVCPNLVQQDMLLARSKFISFSHQNIFALWEQNTFQRGVVYVRYLKEKVSLSLPKVSNAGSDLTKKTPEKREHLHLTFSIPVLCNTFSFWVTLVCDVLLGTKLSFSLRRSQSSCWRWNPFSCEE